MLADELNIDELFFLKKLIDEFISAINNREYAFCEGLPEYQDGCNYSEEVALQLKAKIRLIAIECGLHKEFLEEYSESLKKNGLLLTDS